jgi:hypothetical protein
MKKLLFALLALTIYSSAHANGWVAETKFSVEPTHAQVMIINRQPAPILCRGYLYGIDMRGFMLRRGVEVVVSPGAYVNAYVHTNDPWNNPIVDARADIWCTWF